MRSRLCFALSGEASGIVSHRRLGQRRECRRLGERESRGGLAEVVARGGLHTIPAVPEVDLVDVAFEYLLLAVVALHFACGLLLVELAHRAHVPPVDDVRMHVADELLRDGARATAMRARDLLEELALDCAGNTDEVDAIMLVEALVLDGDERLADVLRQGADGNARSEFPSDLADERTVARVHERRLLRAHDLPRLTRGRCGRRSLRRCSCRAHGNKHNCGDAARGGAFGTPCE